MPKIDELNCPTPAEIVQNDVKPRDGEGNLIRRKWKKKVLFVPKAEAAEKPANTLKTPTPPLFPKGTIKPSERKKAKDASQRKRKEKTLSERNVKVIGTEKHRASSANAPRATTVTRCSSLSRIRPMEIIREVEREERAEEFFERRRVRDLKDRREMELAEQRRQRCVGIVSEFLGFDEVADEDL